MLACDQQRYNNRVGPCPPSPPPLNPPLVVGSGTCPLTLSRSSWTLIIQLSHLKEIA